MADLRQIVRRERRGCAADFIQRVRLGLIVASFILAAAWLRSAL